MAVRTDRRGPRILAVILIALAAAWGIRAASVRPPRPLGLDHVDAGVARLIDEHVRRVRLVPLAPGPWTSLGMVYEANGMDEPAAACYARAVRWPWAGARGWYRLAMTRHALGDVDGALAAIARAQAIDETFAPLHWREGLWLLEAARTDEAEAAFDRAIAVDGGDDAGWIGRARIMLRRGRTEAAIALLEEWRFRRGPCASSAHHLLGTALARRGEVQRARIELDLARKSPPQWRDRWTDELASYRRGRKARLDHADALMREGAAGEALALLEPLADEFPDDLTIANNLAVALIETGRVDDAVKRLERAAVRDPVFVTTQLNLASALYRRGDFAGALRASDRAIALGGGRSRAYESRGAILTGMERYAEAAVALDEASRLDPGNPRALRWAGQVQLQLGRADEAVVRLERAIDRAPGDVEAWLFLALARVEAGDGAGAQAALASAAIIDPAHPRLDATRREVARKRTPARSAAP
jgi:tetratricopeptide (TPR) repeat protein